MSGKSLAALGGSGTPALSSIGPRQVRPFVFGRDDVADVARRMDSIGIRGFSPAMIERMMHAAMDSREARASFAMDDLQGSVTPANITTPIQFLQFWLPGFIGIVTAARKIDELVGISTMGDWEDEEIVQGVLEQLGTSLPYGDLTNVPLASYNADWERRTIVRFEEGLRVGKLEEARSAKVRINSAETKRGSAQLQLEIRRNSVGFFGFNGGNNRTYGFLNDPNLPAAVQFPLNGGGTSRDWSQKTFAEIQKDIRLGVETIRITSQDLVDPEKTEITLGIPTQEIGYLGVTTDFGYSVRKWLTDTYPKVRVVSAPEFYQAVGGVSVAYFYAEQIDDTVSTDDKRTWLQAVPAKTRLIGVQQMAKGYEEDYSNATAGVFLKRPFVVARFLYA